MVTFSLIRCRFNFEALEAVVFPPGKAANVLRGALGTLSEEINPAAYLRFFEPSAVGAPSGLAAPPRPFVLRAAHLDGKTIAPGVHFHFDLHLFNVQNPDIEHLTTVFTEFAHAGLGSRRSRAIFVGQEQSHLTLHLDPWKDAVPGVHVEFVTPTELKSSHEVASRPEFRLLFARIRDRISTLRELYGPGPLTIDFRAMAERASLIKLETYDQEHVAVERRSSKTGQVHSIGGYVGSAEYRGELAEFMPFLEVAAWTGVGRQTVWGKGELRATPIYL